MVSTEASLPAVALLMVVLLLNDSSPAQGASRHEPGPAKQTAQRVLARYAQGEMPPATLTLSLRECIALALERNFDIHIEGFNPKIRTADVVNERAEFDPSFLAGYLFSGGKEQLDDAPSRFPPNGGAKGETSTPGV